MPTAFQTEFVIKTECELLGRTPSDHADGSSQLPLAGLIQLFVSSAWLEMVNKNRGNVANRQPAKALRTLITSIAP